MKNTSVLQMSYVICTKSKPGYPFSTHFAFWEKCVFWKTLSADKRSPRFSGQSQKSPNKTPTPQHHKTITKSTNRKSHFSNRKNIRVLHMFYVLCTESKPRYQCFHPFCILKKVRVFANAKCWQALTAIFQKITKKSPNIAKTTKQNLNLAIWKTRVFCRCLTLFVQSQNRDIHFPPILHFEKSAFFEKR